MKPALKLATSIPLLMTGMGAYAQGGSPGGVIVWLAPAAGGFLAGLAAGLLWCWLRCRARKDADRQNK